MKIFITGGTGFIGSHLVHMLLAEGHSLRCLVRPSSRTQDLQRQGVELVYGDVNDRAALIAGMQGCDWLFHLANLYSMWLPDRSQFTRVNIDGTRAVLESALQVGIKKVVYVSTVAVFGTPADCPFCEDSQPGARLFSEYARTKAAADQLAWELFRTRGLPLVVLYPGIVLGPGDEKPSGVYMRDLVMRRVPSVIFGRAYATYVAVQDVCRAVLLAAQKQNNLGEKYLIGKESYNGLDYVRLICDVAQVSLPFHRFPDWFIRLASYLFTALAYLTGRQPLWGLSIDAGKTLQAGFRFDGSKSERELGLAYTPIRAAIQDAVNWYRQQQTVKTQAQPVHRPSSSR